MVRLLVLSILLCTMILYVNCYKILVFSPTISRSHMISNARIAEELGAAGHEVVLFEPDFLTILDKVSLPVKYSKRWFDRGYGDDLHKALKIIGEQVFVNPSLSHVFYGWHSYQVAYNNLCKDLINRDEVIEALRKEKFDAYFGEMLNICGHGLAQAVGIRTFFWISSCTMPDYMASVIGQPMPLAYVPSILGVDQPKYPSYLERIKNILCNIIFVSIDTYSAHVLTGMFREKFGDDFPAINEIAAESDIAFVATDEFIHIPRPTLPHVVHIGGLGIEDTNASMDETFAREFDKAKKGVIFFSLGSVVSTKSLPPTFMKNIIDIAKKLTDYHFIIKIDEGDKVSQDYAVGAKNIYLTEWAPQVSLLADPRMITFITHAGYNGVMEAARAGVPLVPVPFIFDQIQNGRAVDTAGWGILVPREAVRDDPQQLEDAILKVATDPKYKERAKRMSFLIRNKPFNAAERLVKHTEFVLKAGGVKELLVEGRKLTTFRYYNLDIFVPFGIIVFVISWQVAKLLFRIIVHKLSGKQQQKKLKSH